MPLFENIFWMYSGCTVKKQIDTGRFYKDDSSADQNTLKRLDIISIIVSTDIWYLGINQSINQNVKY